LLPSLLLLSPPPPPLLLLPQARCRNAMSALSCSASVRMLFMSCYLK
jgi:hypothetical protein